MWAEAVAHGDVSTREYDVASKSKRFLGVGPLQRQRLRQHIQGLNWAPKRYVLIWRLNRLLEKAEATVPTEATPPIMSFRKGRRQLSRISRQNLEQSKRYRLGSIELLSIAEPRRSAGELEVPGLWWEYLQLNVEVCELGQVAKQLEKSHFGLFASCLRYHEVASMVADGQEVDSIELRPKEPRKLELVFRLPGARYVFPTGVAARVLVEETNYLLEFNLPEVAGPQSG
jgi:hypothetical protein